MFHITKRRLALPVISVLLALSLLGQTWVSSMAASSSRYSIAPAGFEADQAMPQPRTRVSLTKPAAPDACPPAPFGLPSMIERTNFCVYYNNANTSAVQATIVANHVEAYWDRYVNDFGFLAPAFIGKLEVRIENNPLCNGFTGSSSNSLTVFNGCFDTSQSIQKVIGHELFHRVQYSYDGLEAKWFKEGTARAMEDNAFDNIDNWATALTAMSSSFNKQVNNYLANTDADITSYDSHYNSALWWKYFTEQYGHAIDYDGDGDSEPELGVDAFRLLWEATVTADDIAAVNAALSALGANVDFNTAFRRFTVANWTKDLSGVPDASYNYIDEDQVGNPAPYGPLIPVPGGTINISVSAVWNDQSVSRYGARYYEAMPGSNCPVISAAFHRDSGPDAFYHIITQKGTAFASHVEGSGADWTQSFLNDGITKIVAIIGGQANSAQVDLTLSCANPVIDIQLPNSNATAFAGLYDNPGKFLTQVLVTNGSPTAPVVAGLTYSNFTAKVNGLDTTIAGGGFVQEQYWLVVQAPAQSASGAYDLEIALADPTTGAPIASDSNATSVVYDTDHTDQVLVIDRSGSMGESNKMAAARDAANLYVDITRDNDGLAVVPYNHDINPLPFDMVSVNSVARANAKAFIGTLAASGATSIGDGLQEAVNQRAAGLTGNPRCSFVLMSDGMENTAAFWADVQASVVAANCPVTSIAFGPASNETLMQGIATATGGSFFYNDVFVSRSPLAPDAFDDTALDLSNTYEYAQARGEARQRLAAEKSEIEYTFPAVEQVHTFNIDDTVSEALFVLDWNQPEVAMQLRLRDPHGNVIDSGTLPYTFYDFNSAHLGWRIQNPTPGRWEMLVSYAVIGLEPAPAGRQQYRVPYQVLVSGHSNLTLDLLLPDRLNTSFFTGNRVPIYAFLSTDAPVAEAQVEAVVTAPDGAETAIHLFDDGQHADGVAGDGFYGNIYTRVNQATATAPSGEGTPEPLPPNDEGAYRVRIRATYTGFQREALGSFSVLEGEDINGNGLPDTFEIEHGISDPLADPDLDGLANLGEYQAGTDPNNSDTDAGGENDGSEVLLHQQDPLNLSDDQVEAPAFLHVAPENGATRLTYDVKDEYAAMQLYRAIGSDGPWILQQATLPLDGIYDDPATNGVTFFYRLIAIDRDDHRSVVIRSEPVTPKIDPTPPEARITIDNGALSTVDLSVTLSFVPYETEGDVSSSFDDIAEMQISNGPFFAGAQWRSFTQNVAWELAPTEPNALAHVYARFRDTSGNESLTEVAAIEVESGADLAITKTVSPNSTNAGHNLTYTIHVTNNGPADASDVTVIDTLPESATFESAAPNQGNCTEAGGIVTCNLGNLASGANTAITIVVTPNAGCRIVNRASVVSNEADPDTTNNNATRRTTVALDDFNRPDGLLRPMWRGQTEGYRIRSDRAVVRTGGPIYWRPTAYGADQEACVTLTRIDPRSEQHALMLKVQKRNDWRQGAILVSYNARSGKVDVEARDVGNTKWVRVGSFTPPTPVEDGDQLRARALANGKVRVFINNTLLGIADAGDFYAGKGGQIGLWFDDAQMHGEDDGFHVARRALLDDFSGGTITRPTPNCLDFQALTPFPQTFPGPTFTLAPLDFTNPRNPAGVPMSIELTDRPEDWDGKPELNVGFSGDGGGYQPLFAEFPSTAFPNGVRDVSVELRHFAGATVLALDAAGAVVSTATQPTQNVRAPLSLPGSGISRLQFNTVETLLYKICWTR